MDEELEYETMDEEEFDRIKGIIDKRFETMKGFFENYDKNPKDIGYLINVYYQLGYVYGLLESVNNEKYPKDKLKLLLLTMPVLEEYSNVCEKEIWGKGRHKVK